MTKKTQTIENYRLRVKKANKETPKKEAFISLLNQLYGHNDDTKQIIGAITGGAEKPVINIPRKNESKRGSADTLYNKVIIEFENDIKGKAKLKHAKEQLADLSQAAHQKATEFLRETSPSTDLSPHALGRLRLDVKKYLKDEMKAIDELVEELITR